MDSQDEVVRFECECAHDVVKQTRQDTQMPCRTLKDVAPVSQVSVVSSKAGSALEEKGALP